MANVVQGSTQRPSAGSSRRSDPVWLAAAAVVVLGAISAVLAFWSAAARVELALGVVALLITVWAQLESTDTNQRWLLICGAVAGGFGAGMAVGHGALS